MIPLIARQSVIIKCNMQKSILTGNYEFYYAAGLMAKLADFEIADDIRPDKLSALIRQQIEGGLSFKEPASKQARYLEKMLLEYTPGKEYEEQMRELLLWGMREEHLWTVHLSNT